MILVADIIKHLNSLYPEASAEDWDNVGLLIGRRDKEVKKALLTLDVDINIVLEAIEIGADIIISHHPVIFNPIKSITDKNGDGEMISLLIKNDISVYSAHTNLDVAEGGLNDYAARLLGIGVEGVLSEETGLGRYGEFDKEYTLLDVVERCKTVFKGDIIRFIGDENKPIKKAAIVTGSGMSEIDKCYEKNIDLFITGDVKYSGAREAIANGISIIDAGHYGTEFIVTDLLYDVLTKNFKDSEFIKSKTNTAIFDTI